MKKHLSLILCALSCLLTLVCLVRISSLENKLNRLQNNMGNMQNILRDDILNISSHVYSSMEENSSLLSSSNYTLENPNLSRGTVDLNCVITLKEFEPDGTTAVLTCNDNTYPMNLKNGSFVAKVPLSLFHSSKVTQVSFTTDGTVRTQALDWYLNPREEFVPTLYADFSGGTTMTAASSSIQKDGHIQITVVQPSTLSNEIQSIALVQSIDGNEVERTELLNQEDSNAVVFGKTQKITIENEEPLEIDVPLNKSFSCPRGSTLRLYIEMSDSSSYIHRSLISQDSIDENGTWLDDDSWWYGAEGSIYNSDNTLIYGFDMETGLHTEDSDLYQ